MSRSTRGKDAPIVARAPEKIASLTSSRVATSAIRGTASAGVTEPTVPPVATNTVPAAQAAMPNIDEFIRMNMV